MGAADRLRELTLRGKVEYSKEIIHKIVQKAERRARKGLGYLIYRLETFLDEKAKKRIVNELKKQGFVAELICIADHNEYQGCEIGYKKVSCKSAQKTTCIPAIKVSW